MPCTTRNLSQARIDAALKRLEDALGSRNVGIVVGRNGALAFSRWDAASRDGLSDVCAYRMLSAKGSFALRTALATAEAKAGRKVDLNAVAAGIHSHDGGHTWGRD